MYITTPPLGFQPVSIILALMILWQNRSTFFNHALILFPSDINYINFIEFLPNYSKGTSASVIRTRINMRIPITPKWIRSLYQTVFDKNK